MPVFIFTFGHIMSRCKLEHIVATGELNGKIEMHVAIEDSR